VTLSAFSPAARAWFEASFEAPTDAQRQGWPAIAEGRHTLLLAPTGSGKTLAAFLWAIDRLAAEPPPERERRTRVLYISPLRALAVDVEKNLREPLVAIRAEAERLGAPLPHVPTVGVRTGDTDSRERRGMLRNPPDILITTPESLYLMLTSQARETLRSVTTVIVDEIHVMAATKRGAHLMLSLERLAANTERPFQRIGLSATQRPLDEIARFLGGFEAQSLVDRIRLCADIERVDHHRPLAELLGDARVLRENQRTVALVHQRCLLRDEIETVEDGVHEQDVVQLVRRDGTGEVVADLDAHGLPPLAAEVRVQLVDSTSRTHAWVEL